MGRQTNLSLDGGTSDTTLFLVGRELCLFERLDARKVPVKERNAFVSLAVRRAAPFPDPDFDVSWGPDGMASIWYWSRARVAGLAANEVGRRKRFSAEALYLGAIADHGTDLLQLVEGVEARAWKSGQLLASRWWPDVPTPAQWRDFLRGAGITPSDTIRVPVPTPTTFAPTPWSRRPSRTSALKLSGLEQYLPRAAFASAVLALLAIGAELGGVARAEIDIWRAHSAANRLDAPLKRILAARDAADKAGKDIDNLLTLHGMRPTTSLMAEMTRLMSAGDWQVKRWHQSTPDSVEVTLVAPGINPEQLVSKWEESPMFAGVTTELDRDNELIIKSTVTPPPRLDGEQAP